MIIITIIIIMATLYNKVHYINKHELRMNNTSTSIYYSIY